MGTPNWDEALHPREPKGSPGGGQFSVKADKVEPAKKAKQPEEPKQSKLGPTVEESKAELTKRGFKLSHSPNDLPDSARDQLEAKAAPTGVSMRPTMQGFNDALNRVDGTALQAVKDHAEDIGVSLVAFEGNAQMATVTGDGHAIFVINQSDDADYGAALIQHSKDMDASNTSTAGWAGVQHYRETGDIGESIRKAAEVSALHEFAHLTDHAMREELTSTWNASIRNAGWEEFDNPPWKETIPMPGTTPAASDIENWLTSNISGYAGHGYGIGKLSEGMAETASKYMTEGKVPRPLDKWATEMIGKPQKLSETQFGKLYIR